MLSPQDITDKVFVKAVFGGYDMTGVDEFLEAVNEDYAALYKENAILKGKLKVLVEKVEEYRSTEDSMRMALLTAQRMGEEVKLDANQKRDEIIRNAELEAQARIAESARSVADEEMRLNIAAKETAKFIELSQTIIRKHSEFLAKLEAARRVVASSQQAPAGAAQGAAGQGAAAGQAAARQQAGDAAAQQQAAAHDKAAGAGQDAALSAAQGIAQGTAQEAAPQEQPQPRDEISEQIGSTVEMLMGEDARQQAPQTPQTPQTAEAQTASPVAPIIDFEKIPELSSEPFSLDRVDEALSPRPKFDFEDLRFGANLTNDES